MREKEFINKVHKALPSSIYKWKINDPYHGGVPDTFYAGPKAHCFIEYKYIDQLPAKCTSKVKFNLSSQQRIWLTEQSKNNVFTYAVLGSGDQVYVTENFEIKNLTVEEFNKGAIPFKTYIEVLTKFCLGET
jgi:hypothetical protein